MTEEQPAGEQPKIIVDDDWKAQAQAEKQKLNEQVKQSGDAPGASTGPAGPGERRQLPEASITTLVTLLANQALLALGGMEDPETKRRIVDLDLAKHQIDTLSVLEAKTKGNLTDEEQKLLDTALYQIRMQFVAIAQAVSAGPGGGEGAAPAGPTIQEA